MTSRPVDIHAALSSDFAQADVGGVFGQGQGAAQHASAKDRPAPTIRPADASVYRRNKIICAMDALPEIDLFRTLTTQIVNWLSERRGRVLAVTSCGAGEGKTFMSINLAICLSRFQNYQTVLVDADLRRPNVCRTLGLKVDRGLDTVLGGLHDVEDCVFESEIEGMSLLPTKSGIPSSSPLLTARPVNDVSDRVLSHVNNKLVLFDLPPLLLGDSCVPFLKNTDGCLLLVEEGKTTRAHIKRAISLIKPEKFIGIVLNKTSSKAAQEYGYYSYEYYSQKKNQR
ncbi:MAG: CpsD/CapB family tyrosine-protein kinase [Alphaproteobacteria bacterium]